MILDILKDKTTILSNHMNNYFKRADQEQQLLDEYIAYKEQEEQLVILEEIRQHINEQEGYNYEL